jgi:hypothetical protein
VCVCVALAHLFYCQGCTCWVTKAKEQPWSQEGNPNSSFLLLAGAFSLGCFEEEKRPSAIVNSAAKIWLQIAQEPKFIEPSGGDLVWTMSGQEKPVSTWEEIMIGKRKTGMQITFCPTWLGVTLSRSLPLGSAVHSAGSYSALGGDSKDPELLLREKYFFLPRQHVLIFSMQENSSPSWDRIYIIQILL